ncbi:MAG: hypothetical protein PHG66_01675 [Candidatus Colwellbacteria bacterium]|nr:hypothetical protein [Candidatus Colwellbacteria bacterium]
MATKSKHPKKNRVVDTPRQETEISTPQAVSTVAYTTPLLLVSQQEYNDLKLENTTLRNQVSILTGNADKLRQDNDDHVRTIEILKEENQKLRDEIAQLKITIQSQDTKISTLETNMNSMMSMIRSLNDDKTLHKLELIIQDINSRHKLENDTQFGMSLKDIRSERNGV